jgi:hypothetical protein
LSSIRNQKLQTHCKHREKFSIILIEKVYLLLDGHEVRAGMQLFLCAHVYNLKPINCSIKENRRKKHKILKTIKLTGNKQPRDRALAITHETNDLSPVYNTV